MQLTRRLFTEPELHSNESEEQYPEEHEKCYNPSIGPVVRCAAPLERQQQANYCADKQDVANRVESHDLADNSTSCFLQLLIDV